MTSWRASAAGQHRRILEQHPLHDHARARRPAAAFRRDSSRAVTASHRRGFQHQATGVVHRSPVSRTRPPSSCRTRRSSSRSAASSSILDTARRSAARRRRGICRASRRPRATSTPMIISSRRTSPSTRSTCATVQRRRVSTGARSMVRPTCAGRWTRPRRCAPAAARAPGRCSSVTASSPAGAGQHRLTGGVQVAQPGVSAWSEHRTGPRPRGSTRLRRPVRRRRPARRSAASTSDTRPPQRGRP